MAEDMGLLFVGLFLLFIILIMLSVYIYSSLALMFIARRTKTPNAWLAWIPIGNIYLTTQIARLNGWWTAAVLLAWIPFIGVFVFMGLFLWWWWIIAERVNMPGWTGLLMGIPIVNLVMLGIFAWKD